MVWKLNLTQRHSENFPSLKNRLVPPLFKGDSLEGCAIAEIAPLTARRTEPALELTRYTRN